jgi:uncharacterized protein (DUF433 family)
MPLAMNRRTVSPLGAKGARLLVYLVSQINSGRIKKSEPKTFISYREIITAEPGKRGGRLCIRGMRITVGDILGWFSVGMSEAKIIGDLPELTAADLHAALAFAADRERHTASLASELKSL